MYSSMQDTHSHVSKFSLDMQFSRRILVSLLFLIGLLAVMAISNTASAAPGSTVKYLLNSKRGTADPTARVFDNKLYVYTSTDSPEKCQRGSSRIANNNFCMPGYQVYWTTDKNLKFNSWKGGNIILKQEDVSWADQGTYRMWAPDVVKAGDTYYLFFPAPLKGSIDRSTGASAMAIGVATSRSATGPFVPRSEPLIRNIDAETGSLDERKKRYVPAIDPSVVKVNGSWFLFTGGTSIYKLTHSGSELFTGVDNSSRTDLDADGHYVEGPFAYVRNGNLWLQYAIVSDGGYRISHAQAKNNNNPLAGFNGFNTSPSQEVIRNFDKPTNHGSVVTYKGKSWAFYHINVARDAGPDKTVGGRQRCVVYSAVTFNGAGGQNSIHPTAYNDNQLKGGGTTPAHCETGVAPPPPTGGGDPPDRVLGQQIEVELSDSLTKSRREGDSIAYIEKGGKAKYSKVNVAGAQKVTIRYSSATNGGKLLIRLGGKSVGTFDLPPTGSWSNYREVTFDLSRTAPGGDRDLILIYKSRPGSSKFLYNLDWVKFTK